MPLFACTMLQVSRIQALSAPPATWLQQLFLFDIMQRQPLELLALNASCCMLQG